MNRGEAKSAGLCACFVKCQQALIFFFLFVSQARAAVTIPDAATMLSNFSVQVPALMRLVTGLAYVMGFYFVYKGLMELKKFGEQRTTMSGEHHLKGPLIYLFVGALLIYLPTSVHTGLSTLFTSPVPIAYDTLTGDMWGSVRDAVFLLIQLVGTISFIRGLVLLTHLGGQGAGQPGTFGKAIAHIVAGILCINLYGFLEVISATLGLQWA